MRGNERSSRSQRLGGRFWALVLAVEVIQIVTLSLAVHAQNPLDEAYARLMRGFDPTDVSPQNEADILILGSNVDQTSQLLVRDLSKGGRAPTQALLLLDTLPAGDASSILQAALATYEIGDHSNPLLSWIARNGQKPELRRLEREFLTTEADGFRQALADSLAMSSTPEAAVLLLRLAARAPGDWMNSIRVRTWLQDLKAISTPSARRVYLAAAASADTSILRELLGQTSAVDSRDEHGRTLLMAILVGNSPTSAVEAFIASGADVNARDRYGMTPLLFACLSHDLKVTRSLIAAGADVSATDSSRRNCFLAAAERASTAANSTTISRLLGSLTEAGADLNARDRNSRTALMMAAAHGDYWMAKNLLELGADTDLTDTHGLTALDHARANYHVALVELLSM